MAHVGGSARDRPLDGLIPGLTPERPYQPLELPVTATGRRDRGVLLVVHGLCRRGEDLREAPVQNDRFPELAEHDVVRLDVPMDHAAAVGEGDGLTEPGEGGQ